MSEIKNNINNDPAEFEINNGECVIYPVKPLIVSNSEAYDSSYFHSKTEGCNKIIFDSSKLEDYDSYFIIFVIHLSEYAEEKGIEFELRGMSPQQENFYKAFTANEIQIKEEKPKSKMLLYFENVGRIATNLFDDFKAFMEFIGSFLIKSIDLALHPKKMRWKDFPYQFLHNGVNALPIVLLIVFLLGLISAYQGARQLAQFGADIYIADLVGISITRELSPIMTAILVAGRSGSAFAAEIGTMKVSEEIDALDAMGFNPMQFLVIPRVLSIIIAMPFLTVLADIAGILGGLVAALGVLDVTAISYWNQIKGAVLVWDVLGGLIKSVVFGGLIALTGCFRGMQVTGGAESVGKFTTTSVVNGVLLIIIFDAIFTFFFQTLGI